jgi:hypothetical protein
MFLRYWKREDDRAGLGRQAKSRTPLEGGVDLGVVLGIMDYEPRRSQGTDLFGVHR